MRDAEEYREIMDLGGEDWEPPQPRQPRKPCPMALLTVQAALCVLVLLALAALKLTRQDLYADFTQWYTRESARQIELPGRLSWAGAEEREPEPEPSPTPAPAAGAELGAVRQLSC